MKEYTPKQRAYIDSMDDKAHQSAVEIIGQLENDLDQFKNRVPQMFLEWRSINTDLDKPCGLCGGSGTTVYGDSSTWRGGGGGQTMTSDICDKCWGSGIEDKPWANLRRISVKKKEN